MENKLKALRRERKMTQEHLSKLVGVSRQSIVAIENGKYDPSLQLAFKIARVFDRSIEEIFIFDEEVDEWK